MIKPATIDLTVANGNGILQGSPWEISVNVSEREDGIDTPVDISDMIGACIIKDSAKSREILAAPAFATTDGPGGNFRLNLTATQTAAIPAPGKHHRETSRLYIEVRLDEDRALQGTIEISPTLMKE
ncbi:hypothetical protein SDC9_11718 [bioreactor metagenome]|uniref:Uncharacterized protein n=1 Tax=bioreactor metagenome TaxID=1076179 RepID=A0A644TGR1_9ZZZZ